VTDGMDALRKLQQSLSTSADLIRKYTTPSEQIAEMLKALDSPAMKAIKAMQNDAAAMRLALERSGILGDATKFLMSDQAKQSVSLMRSFQGPLADVADRFRNFAGDPELQRQMTLWAGLKADYDKRFRVPELQDATRRYAELLASSDGTRFFARNSTEVVAAFAKMQKPWLDAVDGLRSVRGFAELQGIGGALNMLPPFGDELSTGLRSSLGDWRDRITFPPAIFEDLAARAAFYVDRGFDPALTDLPIEAFEASADIAGLRGEPPPLIAIYEPPFANDGDASDDAEFARTNQAHDWLQRMESQLRRFIDKLMTNAFGPDWAKHRLPNGMYDEWEKKQAKAVAHGRDNGRRLIAYADFTDYERVICRDDNWKIVFARFFVRQEFVRETFQRLYPIRVDTMHGRPITQDDELFLWVEVRRIALVLGKPDD
jgi:hypothetical protein